MRHGPPGGPERQAGMDIRQLRYFLAVAREGQFTRAAARLHMAQPPLSQQIRLLEEELHVRLFNRTGHGIVLTPAGVVLRERAEQILEMMDSTRKELTDLHDGLHGVLNIGTVASSGAGLLPRLMCRFHAEYSHVVFQVWEGDTFRVAELLERGVVEIGIVRTPFQNSDLESLTPGGKTVGDPMAAAGLPGLLGGTGPVPLAGLREQPLILHRRYESLFTDACRAADVEPRVICRGDDIRSLLTWAESGLGIAIVPEPTAGLIGFRRLRVRRIDAPALRTGVAVVWPKNRYLSAAAQRMIRLFADEGATEKTKGNLL